MIEGNYNGRFWQGPRLERVTAANALQQEATARDTVNTLTQDSLEVQNWEKQSGRLGPHMVDIQIHNGWLRVKWNKWTLPEVEGVNKATLKFHDNRYFLTITFNNGQKTTRKYSLEFGFRGEESVTVN